MSSPAAKFELQRKSWGKLKRLHPSPIDLGQVARIRGRSPADLRDPERLEALILELGLNDDGLEDFPPALRPHCGHGLRIWQYPEEFARYLAQLLRLGVGSYLELGVRHGGTFVATVECLARCGTLTSALAVDVMPCPSMAEYSRLNPAAAFLRLNTQSPAFERALDEHGPFDAALVDANHDEEECRHELAVLRDRCAMVALHDIANTDFPAIGRVWADLRALPGYRCWEYVAAYPEPHTPMGIGLAVREEAWEGRRPCP
jgi:cephalosporin hydroxylase